MPKPSRPLGVTVLALLEMIFGVLLVLVGALVFGGASYLSAYTGTLLASVFAFIGVIALIVGVFAILIGYGLWTGKGWAWTLAFVFTIIGLAFGLFSLLSDLTNILGVAIDALIIWYLWKPHVKAYFGKGTMPTPAQPAAAQPKAS